MSYFIIIGVLLILTAIALFVTASMVDVASYVYYIIGGAFIVIAIILFLLHYLFPCRDVTANLLLHSTCIERPQLYSKCAKNFQDDAALDDLYKSLMVQCDQSSNDLTTLRKVLQQELNPNTMTIDDVFEVFGKMTGEHIGQLGWGDESKSRLKKVAIRLCDEINAGHFISSPFQNKLDKIFDSL